ncbi:MAG: DnaA/Hda family protein [Pseudomonadota bacterium]
MAKKTTSQQLPLFLPIEAASARDDLVVGPSNHAAVEFLDAWPQWSTSFVVLAGPVGAGKSHLAQVWASRASATFLKPPLGNAEFDLREAGNFVVEDIAQGAFDEQWLFHLFNLVRSNGGSLLLTSRRWPGEWGIALPDLQSRMKTAHLIELAEPDDALLSGVLFKLLSDRQMTVDHAVIDYCTKRMERSLAFARRLVDTLDHMSLSQKRPVTVPLAAEALEMIELVGNSGVDDTV